MRIDAPQLMASWSGVNMPLTEAKISGFIPSFPWTYISIYIQISNEYHVKNKSSRRPILNFSSQPSCTQQRKLPNRNSLWNILTFNTLYIQPCLELSWRKNKVFPLFSCGSFSFSFCFYEKSSFSLNQGNTFPIEFIKNIQENTWRKLGGGPLEKRGESGWGNERLFSAVIITASVPGDV